MGLKKVASEWLAETPAETGASGGSDDPAGLDGFVLSGGRTGSPPPFSSFF